MPRWLEHRIPPPLIDAACALLMWAGADRLVQPAGSRAFAAAAPSARVRSQCFDGLYHELFNESPELAAPVFALLRQWLLQQCPAKV